LFTGIIKIITVRLPLFAYIFALILICALFFYFFPIAEMAMGVILIAETSALSSVVSFAQWLIADNTIVFTILSILAAPLPLAILGSLLFCGAFGSFASGMDKVSGFPVMAGMGFFGGYRKRFMHVFTLIYISLALLLLMAFVWIVAAIPLAIIRELELRSTLQSTVFNVTLAVTALVAYISLMFLRVYPVSMIPAMFSGSFRPLKDAVSFAGRGFFRVTRYFIVSDIVLVFLFSLYGFLNGPHYLLIINCLISAILVFFLLYSFFDAYARDGYGFDERDVTDGNYAD